MFHHEATTKVSCILWAIRQMYNTVREQLCLRHLLGLRNSISSSHGEAKCWVRGLKMWGNLHLWRCSAHKVLSNLTRLGSWLCFEPEVGLETSRSPLQPQLCFDFMSMPPLAGK